jgi:hypothetical protein
VTPSPRWHALACALAATLGASAARGDDALPAVRATFARSAPRIDGLMDEPVWRGAPAQGDFVERGPRLGAQPPVATTFRVLFDAQALYLGVHCQDDRPETIQGRSRSRDDFSLFRDDVISIKLDVAHDHRTTYGFALNPVGGRIDYRGIDESDFRVEHDFVWQGAASRVPDGWSAEFRIPLASLGIDPTRAPARIGLNLSRDHSRRSATYDWALLRPPFGPIAASRYGHIDGLDELSRMAERGELVLEEASARRYALIPYALGGFRRRRSDDGLRYDDESRFSGGLDATAEFGAGWRSQLTINTDFAQVDLDNQVVNLTRFGLFFPEKRDFFLSDDEVFRFGRPADAQLFYSRRIGLRNQAEVPILGGLKVVGRPGDKVRIGVMQATTRPTDDSPWTSNLVARSLVELGGGSNVGAMLTHRQSAEDGSDRNLVAGIDGAWRGDEVPLLLSVFALGSITGDASPTAHSAAGGDASGEHADRVSPGGGLSLSLRNQLLRPALGYAYYDPELRTDLGFFRRVGIHQGDASFTVAPRVGKLGLEQVDVGVFGKVIGTADADQLLDWSSGGSAGVDWDAGYRVAASASHLSELVQSDFSVGRSTEIAAGRYDMWLGSLSANTPSVYQLSVSGTLSGRQYYGGELYGASTSLSWLPTTLLRLDVGSAYNRATFDTLAGFDSLTLNGRVNLGFTTRLGLNVFTGYNLLGDVLQLQSRLRWVYAPGSDLFIVYQLDLDDDDWRARFASLVAKSSFRWDL